MKTRPRSFTGITLIGMILIGFCWGCAGVEQKFDDWQSALREKLNFKSTGDRDDNGYDSEEMYFLHTSRYSWETLDYVAEWYTGDSKNAGTLADLNPNVNPDRIAVGSDVVIPASLLKTREPLPRNFAGEYHKDYYKHTVRWPGESLSLIASWYTGSFKNWRKLAKANPGLNPNRIKGGNVIMIPPSMLKTRVPLPQKVAAKYTSDYFAYRVKADNEKLADIAQWYTGNAANRKLLARANPDLNPDRLVRGNEVYIPKKLLKIREPIKSSSPITSDSKPAVKEPAPAPKTAATEDENIKLFGPKRMTKQ